MSIFSVFTLLGGLAFFIYGMNQMSRSLEIIAGEKMEAVINKLTSRRFLGLQCFDIGFHSGIRSEDWFRGFCG